MNAIARRWRQNTHSFYSITRIRWRKYAIKYYQNNIKRYVARIIAYGSSNVCTFDEVKKIVFAFFL